MYLGVGAIYLAEQKELHELRCVYKRTDESVLCVLTSCSLALLLVAIRGQVLSLGALITQALWISSFLAIRWENKSIVHKVAVN